MRAISRYPITVSVLVSALTTGIASQAEAHEFTVAIIGDGSDATDDAQIADVVRGFIVATDERDGHPSETSDGHLGGLDVQILVVPLSAVAEIDALVGTPSNPADIAFLVGQKQSALATGAAAIGPETVVFELGALPTTEVQTTSGFAGRFTALFGQPPSEAAAQGYNAARRIDHAIRPFGELEPRSAILTALAETESGLDW